MSTSDIIAELPRLTTAELHAIEQCIVELTSRPIPTAVCRNLRAERQAGRLILAGTQVVRQAKVEAILEEFP
jgi:hypothetical protein